MAHYSTCLFLNLSTHCAWVVGRGQLLSSGYEVILSLDKDSFYFSFHAHLSYTYLTIQYYAFLRSVPWNLKTFLVQKGVNVDLESWFKTSYSIVRCGFCILNIPFKVFFKNPKFIIRVFFYFLFSITPHTSVKKLSYDNLRCTWSAFHNFFSILLCRWKKNEIRA